MVYFHFGSGKTKEAAIVKDRFGCAPCKAALSSGCKPHPVNSLPPEAIGAVMEVTKWLKPSISVSRIGDSASHEELGVKRVVSERTDLQYLFIRYPRF